MDPLQLVMSSVSVTARIIQYLKRVPVCFVEGANAMKFRITNMTHSGELIAFWPAGLNKKHKTDAYSFFFKQKDHPRVGRIIDLLREGPVVANVLTVSCFGAESSEWLDMRCCSRRGVRF